MFASKRKILSLYSIHIYIYIYILFLLRYYVEACWVSDPAPKSINSKSALPATVGVNDKGLSGGAEPHRLLG